MHVLALIFILLATGCAGIQSRFYKVRVGDNWASIASRYDVPLKDLQESNDEISVLRPGQKISIPFEKRPGWDEPERVKEIAQAPQVVRTPSSDDRVAVEKIDYSNPLVRYVWPVSGRVSSKFGRRHGKFHEGIDIAAPQGMNVRASRSGHIIYSSDRIAGYGNLVMIRHADGYSTIYAHLSKRLVKHGQFVAKGSVIGKVGMTGHASSPHLHFEVRKGQLPVNPMQFLQSKLVARNAAR